jgi:N-acetylglucosaminylphosphatidylinositol deacetylase
VLEDSRFLDGITLKWEADDVATALSQTFASSTVHGISSESGTYASSCSNLDIDVLITFDSQGVSSHANHISLYYGALHWLQQINQTGAAVTLYSLSTTNIIRKYMSLLDSPFSVLSAVLQRSRVRSPDSLPERLLFLSDVTGYRRAQKAMTNGHVSQMLWFRWGWIGLSRYIYVNDLKRQHLAAIRN